MKTRITQLILLVLALSLSACAPAASQVEPTRTPAPTRTQIPTPTWELPAIPPIPSGAMSITVRPQESSELLLNPGKGWVLYYPYEDRPDEIWDVVSVCYSRLDWNWIEPAEGDFQWSFIDDAIETCAGHGKPFAFGIMAANNSSSSEFVTPAWVFEAGAPSTPYTGSANNVIQSPVWNDPVYLEKMQNLILALAERYDGDPNIAYIDARSCGNWGEWHSLGCSELSDQDRAILIDQWSVFTQTTIMVNTNNDGTAYQARYGTDTYGFGIRCDCTDLQRQAVAYAYDKAPTVSEWCGSYEQIKTCSGTTGVCFSPELMAEYMAASHFSYDNLGQWGTDAELFYDENTELVQEWGNRMGYWFKLTEVSYPANLGSGSTENLSFQVRNDGVAPIYVNHNTTYVRLALLDASGMVLAVSDPLSGINPFNWKPGVDSSEVVSFSLPQTPGAAYLAIGLFSNETIKTPDILFGNQGVLPNGWLPIHGEPQP
jgi:hypothetical protein